MAVACLLLLTSCSAELPKAPSSPPLMISSTALGVRLGDPSKADVEIVVYEDFGAAASKHFEFASHELLRTAARGDTATTEYRPFSERRRGEDRPRTWSFVALGFWLGTRQVDGATDEDVYLTRQVLYDEQRPDRYRIVGGAQFAKDARAAGVTPSVAEDGPKRLLVDSFLAQTEAADSAEVTDAPTVFVDGRRLSASTISDLVDQLRALLVDAQT